MLYPIADAADKDRSNERIWVRARISLNLDVEAAIIDIPAATGQVAIEAALDEWDNSTNKAACNS